MCVTAKVSVWKQGKLQIEDAHGKRLKEDVLANAKLAQIRNPP